MHLEQLKHPIHAELIGSDLSFQSISIDSRKITPGQVFVALIGNNLDGHQFIEQAIQNGAVAIIASDKQAVKKITVPVLLVQDTTKALGDIAKFHREQFSLPVIGVTGSSGKTTVKSMLGSIFNQVGNPLVTAGNFNNHIGLPLTLFGAEKNHDILVTEIGTNHLGEIEYLAQIVRPNIAILTCAAAVHLEGLGTLENVAKEKGELFNGLQENGTAILNRDDQFYLDTYNARLWAPTGIIYQNNLSYIELTPGGKIPITGCIFYRFASAKVPEGVIYMPHEGRILITCDSIKNWTEVDKFFSQKTGEAYLQSGEINSAHISPIWLNGTGVSKADFEAMNKIEYKHLISAHGKALLNNAKTITTQSKIKTAQSPCCKTCP